MDRRSALKSGLGLAGLAWLGGCANLTELANRINQVNAPDTANVAGASASQRPIVLVHGAWHGGWCWERVTPMLVRAGRRVYAPTLIGLGDRAHLLTRDVDLNTHIEEIAALLQRENLRNVVLVGHGYAGLIISSVADRMPERLDRLIYLDGALVKSGLALKDLSGPEVLAAHKKAAAEKGGGIGVPPPPAKAFGIVDPGDTARIESRLTNHPLASWETPFVLKNPLGNGVKRMYIDCAKPALPAFASAKALAKADANMQYLALPTGHDAMVMVPDEVAGLILRFAS